MGVMICLGQGGMHSLSASSFFNKIVKEKEEKKSCMTTTYCFLETEKISDIIDAMLT